MAVIEELTYLQVSEMKVPYSAKTFTLTCSAAGMSQTVQLLVSKLGHCINSAMAVLTTRKTGNEVP